MALAYMALIQEVKFKVESGAALVMSREWLWILLHLLVAPFGFATHPRSVGVQCTLMLVIVSRLFTNLKGGLLGLLILRDDPTGDARRMELGPVAKRILSTGGAKRHA